MPRTITESATTAPPATTGRPMQQRAVDTRRSLIDAAARVVCLRGAPGSVNTILEIAGTTKGSAYFHFASKDGMLDAVSTDALRRCQAAVTDTDTVAVTDSAIDPQEAWDAVRTSVTWYVRAAAADPVIRADAILWSDPDHADNARAGVHTLLRTALLAHVESTSDDVVGRENARGAVDLIMTTLTGIGARPGAGVGFDDPAAEHTVHRLLTTLTTGMYGAATALTP